MKLRNLAMVLCASGALLAACGSNDDSAGDDASGGTGVAGAKGTSGAAGTGGYAGEATAGSGNEAGTADNAGAPGMGDMAGMAGMAGTPGVAGAPGEGGVGGEGGTSTAETFTVTLTNVAPVKAFTKSGVFNTPIDTTMGTPAAGPGPAIPGQSYSFTVDAGRKQTLSFATMLAGTNDLFFAPSGTGIPLYDNLGAPIAPTDVTSQVELWDAGTEVNEVPYTGMYNGSSPTAGMGPVDPNNKVRQVTGNSDGVFTYPAVASMIAVNIAHTTGTLFQVTISVLPGALLTTTPVPRPVSLSPGVWVLSNAANPLFTDQLPEPAHGLKALAELGDPTTLGAYAAATTGITYPASPGVWVVHTTGSKPLFTSGLADYGKGLEAIAEDGNATPLGTSLPSLDGYITGAVFNTPVGASAVGAILPGSQYQFSFRASPGDSLSFATMLAATNDVFLAPGASGIPLFDVNGVALTGDVSSQVSMWDAGTEANQEPGIGPDTVTNQLAPNTGTGGEGLVQFLSAVTPTYANYPVSASSVLHVTVAASK